MKKQKRQIKLRGGLDPTPASEASSSERLREFVEQKRKELLKKACSAYWVDELVYRNAYCPNATCNCHRCKRRGFLGWPPHMIMSSGCSFECFLEQTAIDRTPTIKRRISDKEARGEGLSILVPPILVSGCKLCDGLKPRDEKYCLHCRDQINRYAA